MKDIGMHNMHAVNNINEEITDKCCLNLVTR